MYYIDETNNKIKLKEKKKSNNLSTEDPTCRSQTFSIVYNTL